MKANQDYLSTFDLNKDGEIDRAEGELAYEAIMEWALALEDPESRWYYAEGNKPVGPISRDALLAAVQALPDTYISHGEENLWLPFTAVKLAKGT